MIAWRRDIHRHPELSNREFRTAKLVADHLRKLGLPVKTGVAHTGVTAVLKGGKPGAGADLATTPSNHSPLFYIDEPAIGVAARAMTAVAIDYLQVKR